MIQANTVKHRDANAYALRLRAGNAGCAIAVDTRPKSIRSKKHKGQQDRKATKQSLRQGRWD
jgi:hypothetical protein